MSSLVADRRAELRDLSLKTVKDLDRLLIVRNAKLAMHQRKEHSQIPKPLFGDWAVVLCALNVQRLAPRLVKRVEWVYERRRAYLARHPNAKFTKWTWKRFTKRGITTITDGSFDSIIAIMLLHYDCDAFRVLHPKAKHISLAVYNCFEEFRGFSGKEAIQTIMRSTAMICAVGLKTLDGIERPVYDNRQRVLMHPLFSVVHLTSTPFAFARSYKIDGGYHERRFIFPITVAGYPHHVLKWVELSRPIEMTEACLADFVQVFEQFLDLDFLDSFWSKGSSLLLKKFLKQEGKYLIEMLEEVNPPDYFIQYDSRHFCLEQLELLLGRRTQVVPYDV